MRLRLLSMIAVLCSRSSVNAFAAETPKRVLLVTHAGGFMHDSLLTAEKVLKTLGPKHGLQVTCCRYPEIWTDPRFQQHLLGGIQWAGGQAEGDATPSGKLTAANR